jgi:hypothetical protein
MNQQPCVQSAEGAVHGLWTEKAMRVTSEEIGQSSESSTGHEWRPPGHESRPAAEPAA